MGLRRLRTGRKVCQRLPLTSGSISLHLAGVKTDGEADVGCVKHDKYPSHCCCGALCNAKSGMIRHQLLPAPGFVDHQATAHDCNLGYSPQPGKAVARYTALHF